MAQHQIFANTSFYIKQDHFTQIFFPSYELLDYGFML